MQGNLPIQQLDRALALWRKHANSRPVRGWLHATRRALGMTTRQLAKSVGVTQSTLVAAERREAKNDITLATLRRYARALDCELVYALVPKHPPQKSPEVRAEQIARNQVSSVKHSMALMAQQTGEEHVELSDRDSGNKV